MNKGVPQTNPNKSKKPAALKAVSRLKPSPSTAPGRSPTPQPIQTSPKRNLIPKANFTPASSKPLRPSAAPRSLPKLNANAHTSVIPQGPSTNNSHRDMTSLVKTWGKNHVPYLSTLEDPLHNAGVTIPDAAHMQPSATFQFVQHRMITSNANQLAGAMIGLPSMNAASNSYNAVSMVPLDMNFVILEGTSKGVFGLIIGSANTVNAPFQMSNSTAGLAQPLTAPSVSTFIASNVADIRIVSAALSLRCLGSAVTNAGLYTAGTLPFGFFEFSDVGTLFDNLTMSELQNSTPDVILVPAIQSTGGVTVTYNPTDSRNFDFFGKTASIAPTVLTDQDMATVNPGVLFVVASGMGTTSVSYMVDIVINYEFVPKTATIGFQMRDKFVDENAMQFAHNQRELQPDAFTGSIFSGSESGDLGALCDEAHSSCYEVVPRLRGGEIASTCVSFHSASILAVGKRRRGKKATVTDHPGGDGDMLTSIISTVLSVAEKCAPMLLALL